MVQYQQDQRSQMTILQAQLAHREKDCASSRAELDRLRQANSQLSSQLEQTAHEAHVLAQSRDEACTRSDSLAAQLQTQKLDLSAAQTAQAEAEALCGRLDHEVARLQERHRVQHAEQSDGTRALEQALTDKATALDRLQTQLEAQEAYCEEVYSNGKRREQQAAEDLADARAALEACRQELDSKASQLGDLSRRSTHADASAVRLRDSNQQLKSDLREAESLLRQSEHERCGALLA